MKAAFKKAFAVLTAVLMLCCILPVGVFAAETPTVMQAETLKLPVKGIPGDYDGSGTVSVQDAILTLRAAMGLITPTEENFAAADINSDNQITVTDAIMILRMAMGLIEPPTEPAPEPIDTKEFEQRVFELVNQERILVGVEPLEFADDLNATAAVRVMEIALPGHFSHTRPDGTACFTAFPQHYEYMGENIAMGFETPEEVMNAWMNSQGHRENILSPNYGYIGIGCYADENGIFYWVQCFGG